MRLMCLSNELKLCVADGVRHTAVGVWREQSVRGHSTRGFGVRVVCAGVQLREISRCQVCTTSSISITSKAAPEITSATVRKQNASKNTVFANYIGLLVMTDAN